MDACSLILHFKEAVCWKTMEITALLGTTVSQEEKEQFGLQRQIEEHDTDCFLCVVQRCCWELGAKDWSKDFTCLWSEAIMAYSGLSLLEIERPCKHCFQQHRRKGVNKEKKAPEQIMRALAPAVAPWPQFLLANEDQIENAGNIFLATLSVPRFPATGCFLFSLLQAVAVGCLQRERPHPSVGAELSSFHTPGQEPRWHQIPPCDAAQWGTALQTSAAAEHSLGPWANWKGSFILPN